MTDRPSGPPSPIAFNTEGTGWHLKARRRILLQLAAVALGLLLWAAAVLPWQDPAVGLPARVGATAILLLAGAGFMAIAWSVGRRPAPRAPAVLEHNGMTGVLVPTAPPSGATLFAGVVLGSLVLVGMLGSCIESVADTEVPRAPVVVALVLSLVGGTVLVIRRRRAHLGGLWLAPTQVAVVDGINDSAARWSEVTAARATWSRRVRGAMPSPGERISNWLELPTSHDVLRLDVGDLAADPEQTLIFVRHYLDHPDDRHELGDERALARWDSVGRGLA